MTRSDDHEHEYDPGHDIAITTTSHDYDFQHDHTRELVPFVESSLMGEQSREQMSCSCSSLVFVSAHEPRTTHHEIHEPHENTNTNNEHDLALFSSQHSTGEIVEKHTQPLLLEMESRTTHTVGLWDISHAELLEAIALAVARVLECEES